MINHRLIEYKLWVPEGSCQIWQMGASRAFKGERFPIIQKLVLDGVLIYPHFEKHPYRVQNEQTKILHRGCCGVLLSGIGSTRVCMKWSSRLQPLQKSKGWWPMTHISTFGTFFVWQRQIQYDIMLHKYIIYATPNPQSFGYLYVWTPLSPDAFDFWIKHVSSIYTFLGLDFR